ncbi:MAG: hypothetical protein RBU21_20240 [FCB group bacterium]|jgi:hypothetical protein|nr:hypothetical protein [FCB group bacterium]
MPKWKVDAEGNLVDAEGNPVVVEGEPVKVADIDGVVSQETMDTKIEQRLARQTNRIKALEAQANRTPEVERMLENLSAEKAEYEAQAARALARVNADAGAEVQRVQAELEDSRKTLDAERAARAEDKVKWAILTAAGDRFINPAVDVVPHMMAAHKREEAVGPDGKGTGEFHDLFKVRVKKDGSDDEYEDKYLPADKAVTCWLETHPHYAKSSGLSGSGGGSFREVAGNPRRSQMTDEQKADFVSKHGREAFQKLPE